jgi:hypothetical protein
MATTTKNPSMHDTFERNKYDLKTAATKSRGWFSQQLLRLSKQRITPQSLMRENSGDMKARIIPGNLYMFAYDPKLKDTLPYYDKFPLVFPYASVPGGFMGLNMHYLPYQLRIRLLDRLMVFKNNDKMDSTTRIKYSWALIAGVSKFKLAEPCIKHYLLPHVKTSFKKIDSKDWATAMLLPVERFSKATKENVWKDSQASI